MAITNAWQSADMPDQTGRVVVVTGGTGGLGFECALALAGKGAAVLIAGRNAANGADAVARIKAAWPAASVRFEVLDLASLASIRGFARRLLDEGTPIDVVVNNAGVSPSRRLETADGFELQIGTNHLGHFALGGLLLPLLRRARDARIVAVTSGAARTGKMNFDDLQAERSYGIAAYAQSKLANLLFAQELHRRSVEHGWNVAAVAAHPGLAATKLMTSGTSNGNGVAKLIAKALTALGEAPEKGVRPILFAAASPDAQPGRLYGPDGFLEMRGNVHESELPPQALDSEAAGRLWTISEELTGVVWSPR